MNDLVKAQKFIVDRNNSLVDTAKKTEIGLPTLYAYRGHPEKLKTASWEKVHQLAELYDKRTTLN